MAARLLLPLPEVKAPHPASKAAQAISESNLHFFMVIFRVIFKLPLAVKKEVILQTQLAGSLRARQAP